MRFANSVLMGMVLGFIGVFSLTLAPPAQAQRGGGAVNCFSSDGKFTRCSVPWRDARLVRQDSKTACVRNQTWGMDRQGLWVSRGCRGIFVQGGGGHGGHHGGGGWQPGPGWDRAIRLDCVSSDNRYQMCRVDVGSRGHVRLIRQESRNQCTEGYSWGWNRAGVWVNHGCRADFLVERRW